MAYIVMAYVVRAYVVIAYIVKPRRAKEVSTVITCIGMNIETSHGVYV